MVILGCPERETWDRLIRSGSRSNRRKPWCELSYRGRQDAASGDAGSYRNALEAVRLQRRSSALADNQDQEGRYRLYLKGRLFNRALGKIRLQHVDIGIAMSHFELAAREQTLPGQWDPMPGGACRPRAYGVMGQQQVIAFSKVEYFYRKAGRG